ncbi:protein YgfX [Massilia consociata]|uniref:Protein YgfX n=1 Tax=Massilia consociata TaxID=760117 RepID=A0ABV6FBD5_9BURK
MSIAMTVVIAPSGRLRMLAVGFGASLLAASAVAGLLPSLRFIAGPTVALALLFAGVCVLHAALRPATQHRIDISGVGELRLTVQQGVRQEAAGAVPVTLLPGSTLWPRLMLLRLGTADGRCHPVAVLPDSVEQAAFRALAVALGALAGHVAVSPTEHKIL